MYVYVSVYHTFSGSLCANNWQIIFIHTEMMPSFSRLTSKCNLVSQQTTAKKNTHTHTRLKALCPGLPGWAGTRKVKPIWILLKQETVSGSSTSWAICKSAPRSRQITMPVPHHSVFLQAGCPSCRPTNSIKALHTAKKKKIKKQFHAFTKT